MTTVLAQAVVVQAVMAQDGVDPRNGLWRNEYCINPPIPYIVRLKPEQGEASLLFDVSADGIPENIRTVSASSANGNDRFAKAFAKSAMQTVKRWRYLAYFNNGVEASRSDVSLTFNFVNHGTDVSALSNDEKCLISILPEPPSSEGDPKNPLVNLARCMPPYMPNAAQENKISSRVTVLFDVSRKGKLINISLAPGQEEDTFSKEALLALKHWRYAPFLKAGEPIVRKNLSLDITFGKMPDEQELSCHHAPFGSNRKIETVGKAKRCEITYEGGVPVPSKACYK